MDPMRIPYLVNQYPAPSLVFIRREITALEALGIPVTRYTVRASNEDLADVDEGAERQRTRAVLDVGVSGLLRSKTRDLSTNPAHFARSIGRAIQLGRLDSRRLRIGLIYFAEACVLVESVGRLSGQKGQLLLVGAVGRLLDEGCDIELVLIGDGPMRAEIESHVSSLSRPDAVRLLGLLDNASVRAEMLGAHATVLPSFAEGLPVVLMESLALGRPVVTTHIAGIPELVTEGENGWLVPAGSVDELVTAIRTALDTPTSILDRMGCEGARRVRELHDVNREAGKLAALLRARDRLGSDPR